MASPGRAEVAASAPAGFVLKIENAVAADPDKVFDTVLRIGEWWNSEHTYSGSARNLKLTNEPGGCFCEQLPGGGFVRHGTVEFSSRGKTLRIAGALGPLQGMGAYGLMALTFQKAGAGTKLVVTYAVSGFAPGKGYEELAAPVNEVLTDQFTRLKRYVETGNAEAAKG
ncbi:MAG TPA: SRPBCC family protein [Steroidobacteraceae bacterium]